MEFDEFTMCVPGTSLPSDQINSLPTFWLNVNPSRHTPAFETASEDNYPPKTSRVIVCIFLRILLEIYRKIQTITRDVFGG